jgi:hypothetical protein
MPHRFPSPPSPDNPAAGTRSPLAKVTEPIYVTTQTFGPRYRRDGSIRNAGGEYLSFYYVGFIGPDAVSARASRRRKFSSISAALTEPAPLGVLFPFDRRSTNQIPEWQTKSIM